MKSKVNVSLVDLGGTRDGSQCLPKILHFHAVLGKVD